MLRNSILIALISLPCMASAEIYKCTAPNGKLTFSDRPCAPSTTSETVTIPPPPETHYEKLARERKEAEAQQSAIREQQWNQQIEELKNAAEALKIAQEQRQAEERKRLEAMRAEHEREAAERKKQKEEDDARKLRIEAELDAFYIQRLKHAGLEIGMSRSDAQQHKLWAHADGISTTTTADGVTVELRYRVSRMNKYQLMTLTFHDDSLISIRD